MHPTSARLAALLAAAMGATVLAASPLTTAPADLDGLLTPVQSHAMATAALAGLGQAGSSAGGSGAGGAASFASVAHAGDLDRDGFGDLSVWNFGEGRSMILSGRDGQEIPAPRAPNEAAVAWAAVPHDLGGTAAADVLRVAIVNPTATRECDDDGQCRTAESWTWQVSAHSALGAAPLWAWTTTGRMDSTDNHEAVGGIVRRSRSWVGSTDRLEVRAVPSVLGGPAASAYPLVTSVSTNGTARSGVGPGVGQVLGTIRPQHTETVTATSLTTLDLSGQQVATQALAVADVRERYVLLGDLDTDGRGEFAVQWTSTHNGGTHATEIQSRDLVVDWTRGEFVRLHRVADGRDGRSRVAAAGAGYLEMLSGSNGSVIWRSSAPMASGVTTTGEFEVVAYYLAAVPASGEEGGVQWTAQLHRVDQHSGEVTDMIARVPVGRLTSDEWPSSFSGVDVDGDGRLDLVGQTWDGSGTGRLITITQAGGADVGPSTVKATVWYATNLDGFPGDEVVWRTWDDFDDAYVGVMASRPGQRMWHVDRGDFDQFLPVRGDGATHLAVAELHDDGDPVARLLDGGTLDVRWTVRLT